MWLASWTDRFAWLHFAVAFGQTDNCEPSVFPEVAANNNVPASAENRTQVVCPTDWIQTSLWVLLYIVTKFAKLSFEIYHILLATCLHQWYSTSGEFAHAGFASAAVRIASCYQSSPSYEFPWGTINISGPGRPFYHYSNVIKMSRKEVHTRHMDSTNKMPHGQH